MSLTINQIREKLNILEKINDNPSLIFTDLYTSRVSDNRLFQNIIIDDMSIDDYFEQCISKIDVFKDVLIACHTDDIMISIPAIKYGKYQNLQGDDEILYIDIYNHTYSICEDDINNYLQIINAKHVLRKKELSEFWKDYENYTLSRRFKLACKSFKTGKKIHIKISNFIFNLFISKKTINKVLTREYDSINTQNEYNEKEYNNNMKKQLYYKDLVPNQIDKIKKEQNKLIEYLKSLGYIEYVDEY